MVIITSRKRSYFFKILNIPSSITEFQDAADIRFGFTPTRIIIVNDDTESDLSFSFQKPNLDGLLKKSDGPLVLDEISETQLWFKQSQTNAGKDVSVRVWAWSGGAGR